MTVKELLNFNQTMDIFVNPLNKPLEDLKIKFKSTNSSYEEYIPALDQQWCKKDYTFTLYLPPPSKNIDGEFTMGSKEDWIERLYLFLDDMHLLLQLDFYRFWSEVVFNKQCLSGINSFLQNAPPFYLKNRLPQDKDIEILFVKAQELVFLVLVRLTRSKESEKAWMKTKTLGSILYDNFVFSLPQLMEICLIYACNNFKEVADLINNVIYIQPKYLSDIERSVPFLCDVFTTLEAQLLSPVVEENGTPSRITSLKETLNPAELVKLIHLLLDIGYSLCSFLEACPEASTIFHQHHFEPRLASFYGNVFPELNRLINYQFNDQGHHEEFENCQFKLDLSRHQLISCVHRCLASYLSSILEDRDHLSEEELKNRVDNYLQTMTDCISDHVFMKDYNSAFPVQIELNILPEIYPEFDSVKYDFIIQSVLSLYDLPVMPKNKTVKPNTMTVYALSSTDLDNDHLSGIQPNSKDHSNKKVMGVELDSLITEVKDILPHLGGGFIVKCLEYFDYASADVINAILEDTLPDSLSSLDPEMPVIPPENNEQKIGDLPERINIYDNDEFDIMSQDKVDTSRVHKGKRQDKHKNLLEMLDDKSHVNQLRDVYTHLSLVECIESVNEYEDEYDDTYDDVDVLIGNEGEAEAEERRAFVTPRVLQQYKKTTKEYEYESEEEADGATKSELFLENPEDIRARAEQRWQDMRGRGGRSRATVSHRDVVGKPKGQGQEKEVVVNREFKNSNKASRGNHNRRSMAAKKRRQGMFPT